MSLSPYALHHVVTILTKYYRSGNIEGVPIAGSVEGGNTSTTGKSNNDSNYQSTLIGTYLVSDLLIRPIVILYLLTMEQYRRASIELAPEYLELTDDLKKLLQSIKEKGEVGIGVRSL